MSFTDGTFVLAATRVWQGPDENAQLVTTDADWKM